MVPQIRLPERVGNAFYKRLPHLKEVEEFHAYIDEHVKELPVSKANDLMHTYVNRGSIAAACHVFDTMPKRNAVSWNIIILWYAKHKQGARALDLYARMHHEGVQMSNRTFVGALKACSSLAALEEGKQIDGKFAKILCLRKGRAIHFQVLQGGFDSDLFVSNTLVNLYVKCGSMEDALSVFDELPHVDVVLWNTMILGYAEQEDSELVLNFYARMHQEGVTADHQTFIAALRAYNSLLALEEGNQGHKQFPKQGCLAKGRAIHTQIIKGGCESDVFVGTTLVNIYGKCESMEDAESVFDGLPHRNVVTWTTMILGYAKLEENALALELYAGMHQDGIQPNAITFGGALKACGSLAILEETKQLVKFPKIGYLVKGRAIHFQVIKNGFDSDLLVGNTLVNMYVKCDNMEDAHCVFTILLHRDVIRWNTMILGYASKEDCAVALDLYAQMHQEGVQPNDRTFVAALKACSSIAALEEGKQVDGRFAKIVCLAKGRAIHSRLIKSGFDSDVFVGTTLVSMYAKCGSMEDARSIFDGSSHLNVVTWTTMILAYAEQEDSTQALDLYARMHREGITADDRAFVGALKACSSLTAWEVVEPVDRKYVEVVWLTKGRAIHSQVLKSGFESDAFVGTTLVNLYVKCGSMEDAQRVFDKLPCRDVVIWTTMILGYAEQEDSMPALELYTRMHWEGATADHQTFVGVLKACSSLAVLEEGKQVAGKYMKIGCLAKCRSIHSQAVKSNFESDVFVGTALVNVYAKCGSMEDACGAFEGLSHPNVVTWTAMILGYAEQEESVPAFQLYAQMQEQGLPSNSITFVAILKVCGNLADLRTGKELHSQIIIVGFEAIATVANSLIDFYCKCGSMVDAQQLFDESPIRDVVPWSALIAGYAHQGEGELVFQLFERMTQEGIHPNEVTFLSILSVCRHVGLVDKGQKYFEAMSRHYGINPTIEHYTCIVDLLGRAGQVDEAVEMLEKMPFQPNVVIWLTVLAACRKWKNIEVGRSAFENALRLDRKLPTAYVLMTNIYADAQMWSDCYKIQEEARMQQC